MLVKLGKFRDGGKPKAMITNRENVALPILILDNWIAHFHSNAFGQEDISVNKAQ